MRSQFTNGRHRPGAELSENMLPRFLLHDGDSSAGWNVDDSEPNQIATSQARGPRGQNVGAPVQPLGNLRAVRTPESVGDDEQPANVVNAPRFGDRQPSLYPTDEIPVRHGRSFVQAGVCSGMAPQPH